MQTEIIRINDVKIVEILSEGIIIHSVADGLDLMGNLYYQDINRIILHERNLTPDFFDLKSGIAGEILQKFSNYRVRLAIVGDFTKYTSKSLRDFIRESNKGKQIHFVSSRAEAITALTK